MHFISTAFTKKYIKLILISRGKHMATLRTKSSFLFHFIFMSHMLLLNNIPNSHYYPSIFNCWCMLQNVITTSINTNRTTNSLLLKLHKICYLISYNTHSKMNCEQLSAIFFNVHAHNTFCLIHSGILIIIISSPRIENTIPKMDSATLRK